MGLQQLKTKIEGAVEDLATLEVASFTGNQINLDGVDPGDVFDTIKSGLTSSTLVGYSRFEVEGDAMNYVNSDLGEDKKYLIDGHNSMVEGAQKSRKDFFEFVLKVLGVDVD
ncbi:hypothetical protein [Aquimarina spongiae]|uniref:Uncharacterized protein n=1 Tax=Aquimarina spongiae TaxID=570521 RepID=A0A1M6B7T5_9FLAO|nr:hypothetical protein [Aquimarina spongiae]SHI44533.1 hypothetical protein SAMN04488508_101663 [Aquimarina spongiae]